MFRPPPMQSVWPSRGDARSAQRSVYDFSSSKSRTFCIYGVLLSWLIGIGFIVYGVLQIYGVASSQFSGSASREAIPLGLSFLVTIANEVPGFIHNTSLRWALRREGRLSFNSNIRLLSCAKTSKPNKWYSNMFLVACLVVSYASIPFTIITINTVWGELITGIAPAFLISCGVGILGQAFIASCCSFSDEEILTWSSNALDTVAACLSIASSTGRWRPGLGERMRLRSTRTEGLTRRLGRCMQSVHDITNPSVPRLPQPRQRSACAAHRQVGCVVLVLWVVVLLFTILGSVIYSIFRSSAAAHAQQKGAWENWSPFPAPISDTADGVTISATPFIEVGTPDYSTMFLLVVAFQISLTLGMHCAELIVNVSRDEAVWRQASERHGLNPKRNALLAALASWQTVLLFLFKAANHWMFSLAISVYQSSAVLIRAPQLFYLAVLMSLVAAFCSYIALRRPDGPQPATFGHLQTIADLVDEWPQKGERMYWGRKGATHAGTSSVNLGDVRMDEWYSGFSFIVFPFSRDAS
jgi:hypothetical protein